MNWIASRAYLLIIGLLWVSGSVSAVESDKAVKLIYQEYEQGVDPYQVTYTIGSEHLRIDDASDQSGFIVFDNKERKIFSVSHFDKSILVIAGNDTVEPKSELKVDIEYKPIEGAPNISGRPVYNYRVKAGTDTNGETCMDIQLVPGLLPQAAALLQSYQRSIAAQQVANVGKTPEELRTPCYLVDQVYNTGEYYNKGLPIQEWHSNGRVRQLLNFEETEVDTSIFNVPADYRQFSLQQ
jgi:hypothetical protein